MIKSMTGFAAVTREDDLATLAVTIRAVNHRYLDIQFRLPDIGQRTGPAERDEQQPERFVKIVARSDHDFDFKLFNTMFATC